MFADDLVTFLGSVKGLRKILQVCEKYALTHEIIYNSDTTVGMLSSSPLLTKLPTYYQVGWLCYYICY